MFSRRLIFFARSLPDGSQVELRAKRQIIKVFNTALTDCHLIQYKI